MTDSTDGDDGTDEPMTGPDGVRDQPRYDRYEIYSGGELAGMLNYRLAGSTITLLHTETLEGFEGQGVGGRLVKATLDELFERGLTIVPLCPFLVGWVQRHPDYQQRIAG